jgi:hypothetical protein
MKFKDETKKDWFWVEVENTRKTGPSMKLLAEELAEFARDEITGRHYEIYEKKISKSIVIFEPSSIDERGHNLSHKLRIKNAISKLSKFDVNQRFIETRYFLNL